MKKIFTRPNSPLPPFENADPPHVGIKRNWSQHKILRIEQVAALSFGMNPLEMTEFWNDPKRWSAECVSAWNNRNIELIEAVRLKEIRTFDQSIQDIRRDTEILTDNLDSYFRQLCNSDKSKRKSKKCPHLLRLAESYIQLGFGFSDFKKEMFSAYLYKENKIPKTEDTFTFDEDLCGIYITEKSKGKYTLHYKTRTIKGSFKSNNRALTSVERYFK